MVYKMKSREDRIIGNEKSRAFSVLLCWNQVNLTSAPFCKFRPPSFLRALGKYIIRNKKLIN